MLARVLGLLLMLLCVFAPTAGAQSGWQFRGFATLGLTSADDADLGFRRDLTQPGGDADQDWEWRTDSRLGLQLNRELAPSFDIVVQAVLRDRTRQTLRDTVEWAFLRYRLSEDKELRVGRVGTDGFMLSDYRHVGYAYPWVRPPTEFYGLVPLFSMDGVDYTERFKFGEGQLQAKLFGGRSSFSSSIETAGNDTDFRLHFNWVWGFSLQFDREPWRARLSQAHLEFGDDLPLGELPQALAAAEPFWPQAPRLREQLRFSGNRARFAAAGLAYDDNRWLAQIELSRTDSDAVSSPRRRSGYVSVGRRIGAFTGFALFARVKPLNAPFAVALPPGLPPALAARLEPVRLGAERALNGGRADQHARGLGLRWDFVPQKALKLQWDRWSVEGDGILLWHVGDRFDGSRRDINVFSLTLDLVF